MSTIRYFAYGSNMLATRLKGRCSSASPVTVARVSGYRITFGKRSVDGSGKAGLFRAGDGSAVFGAVFEIARKELRDLDHFEGDAYERRYIRATCIRTGEELSVCTYLAQRHDDGLVPYDWYLALVLAGIDEHAIDSDYARAIRAVAYETDPVHDRETRRAAIDALRLSGIDDYQSLLRTRTG